MPLVRTFLTKADLCGSPTFEAIFMMPCTIPCKVLGYCFPNYLARSINLPVKPTIESGFLRAICAVLGCKDTDSYILAILSTSSLRAFISLSTAMQRLIKVMNVF